MSETEIYWPEAIPTDVAVADIEACCSAIGLTQTLSGALGKYAGCTHWHYKRGKATGVLEITLWPRQNRLWIAIHKNRNAAWVSEAATRLKTEVEGCFQNRLAVLKR
jgi:hypothetical protein